MRLAIDQHPVHSDRLVEQIELVRSPTRLDQQPTLMFVQFESARDPISQPTTCRFQPARCPISHNRPRFGSFQPSRDGERQPPGSEDNRFGAYLCPSSPCVVSRFACSCCSRVRVGAAAVGSCGSGFPSRLRGVAGVAGGLKIGGMVGPSEVCGTDGVDLGRDSLAVAAVDLTASCVAVEDATTNRGPIAREWLATAAGAGGHRSPPAWARRRQRSQWWSSGRWSCRP